MKELLAKLNQLENVFHNKKTEAENRIVSLEGEVQRLSGLLLLPRPSVTSNRAAAAYASSNGQRMTGNIETTGDGDS